MKYQDEMIEETMIVMTLMFLVVIMGATGKRAPQGFAPLAGTIIGAVIYRFVAGRET